MRRTVLLVVAGIALATAALATPGPEPGIAPEIDPGSAVTASALVCSILLMVRGYRKRAEKH